MNSIKYYKTFEKLSLADAASWTQTWTVEADMRIKRIHIIEKAGTTLRKATYYLKIAGDVKTHDLVPCCVLGPDILTSPVLDIALPKGAELSFTIKNNEGKTIDLFVTLELE